MVNIAGVVIKVKELYDIKSDEITSRKSCAISKQSKQWVQFYLDLM